MFRSRGPCNSEDNYMLKAGESNLETRVLACEFCFIVGHRHSGKTSQAAQYKQRIPNG